MRVRRSLPLLAGPAAEDYRLAQAATRPWRRRFEAGEVLGRLQDIGRVELICGEIPAFTRRAVRHPAVRDPAARRAKAGNGEPLSQVLAVVPRVEFLLHRQRRLRHGEEKAAARHARRSWPFIDQW